MPLDPAQRHQIEQDVLTAAWEVERLAICDDAVALLRKIADLERDDDGEVILGPPRLATTIAWPASSSSLQNTTNRRNPQ